MQSMIKVKKDLTGQVFGRLKVIEQTDDYIEPNGTHRARWLCMCLCPEHNIRKVVEKDLLRGHTQSCGCLQKEKATEAGKQKRKVNVYDLTQGFVIGITYNTNEEFYCDLCDFDKIKNYCWSATTNPYDGHKALIAKDVTTGKNITMHRLLTNIKDVDHADQNPLNNRRNNLRVATRNQQNMNRPKQKNNTSGYIGVQWHQQNQKWTAHISIDGKRTYLGSFTSKTDVIITRLQAESQYYKEFAPQRHLFEIYGITLTSQGGNDEL